MCIQVPCVYLLYAASTVTIRNKYGAQMGPRSKYRAFLSTLVAHSQGFPQFHPVAINYHPYYPIINNYITVLRQITWQMIL